MDLDPHRNFINSVHIINKFKDSDIYSGNEQIQFNERHPIFKALMKLEFEDVIRTYSKRINSIQKYREGIKL